MGLTPYPENSFLCGRSPKDAKGFPGNKHAIMSRQTDHFYNSISFLYPLVDLFLKPQKRCLFREINALPAGRLLEIGVGNGHHFSLYTRHQITGIDPSPTMLRIAGLYNKQNIELLEMNGESLSFPDESFDYVVLSHVIAVVDDPDKVLTETCRVLKPGGKILILNHFTPGNWLRYIDKVFQPVAKLLHFRSVFYADGIPAMQKFLPEKEICFGWFSYFKLLIWRKA
jgi:phosphatidylethanolamine/phosphatidyl-N-methylethanolamine N-methyltransferase